MTEMYKTQCVIAINNF